jgi:hypothetical protein
MMGMKLMKPNTKIYLVEYRREITSQDDDTRNMNCRKIPRFDGKQLTTNQTTRSAKTSIAKILDPYGETTPQRSRHMS